MFEKTCLSLLTLRLCGEFFIVAQAYIDTLWSVL